MLNKNEQKLLDDNYLLNKRENSRRKTRFIKQKHRLFLLGVFLGLIIVIALFLASPFSNIYAINVSGNVYLADSYYLDLAGIDTSDKYFLVLTPLVENKIKESPLVESVKVKHDDDLIISIEIKEKNVIGYTYEDLPYLILDDATKIALDEKNLDLISKVPFIEGYNDEEMKLIAKGFKKMDQKMVNEISEIHKYPFSYDDMMMEVIMRDGNYVYLSYYALHLLDNYYSFSSKIEASGPVCIFVDDLSSSAYTSTCPFLNDDQEDENIQENENVENEANDTTTN